MKKRSLTALLITVLLLTILTGSALAEAIETGNAYGMARFTITPEPVNVSDPKLIQENQLKVNMGSSTGTYAKDYEYTITMPAGTQEATVSYEMINSDSTVTQNPNGFFFEFAGDTLNYPSDIMTRSAPSSLKTSTTISLNDGVGVTPRILSYCYSNSGMTAGNYSVLILNGKDMTASYRFRFVTESFPAEFSENLTEHTAYDVGAEKVQPLQVTVSSPDGSSVTYAWFRGSTAESVNEQIENADGSSYTPDVSKVGVTYYRVKATVTTPEGKSGVITSNTAKIAVKDPKVTFSLRSFWGKEIEVVSKEENIYRLTIDKANFGKITGKLTGTIPDDVTIKEIWSGSEADCYDAEKIRAQEPDYDTNTFSLDLNKVVSEADDAWWALTSPAIPPQSHRLGRCLYLKDSNDTVYTLILDSDYQLSAQSAPSMVQLIDANGKSLPDFQVTDLQSDTTSSSVHTGTIQSDTPVVLRAQTYGGGVNLTGELVRDKGSSAGGWNEAQTSWVLVNGEMIGGKCYGGTGTHPAESAAFTLKQGLNVVEVYTNTDPFAFSASRASQTPGLSNSAVGDVLGTSYTYIPVQRTSCVVYLIDYQGTSASNVPQENMQDTTLSDVVALRYGALGDRFETCPLVLQEDGAYLLTLPASFKTEAADSRNYTHCVLINAKPKTPGASAVISSSAKLGESIANTAFLNAETLGDSSFTITVTAADGTTTKDYTVNVNYLSSETKPGIVVEGVKLDNAYNDNTYTYYLEFANASSASGTMTVTVPEGATATVNGTAYTAPVKLDPKEDFYRVTITAADGLNTSSYYFVTKYDDGTTPYTNISDSSKKLAEEMLSGWYDALENDNKFANYWKIFMTKATGGRDGKEYDFNGAYVKDPARHGMSQATDWAACIMEIVMMGRNPYSFPRYVDGELVENFNYVEGLIKQGGGAWGNNVWYHMASKATGARQIMLGAMKSSSLDKMSNLDIRGWSIASLAGCVETKDMVRYIDSLHNVQDTDGKFTSLWTDQSWHGGSSGNTYTIGCVLSAIASAGTDPDRLFAVDGHTPLETIKETLYLENGRFYEGGLPDGDLPKDMIIGLGDILKGSNVWARYALTKDKYDKLIEKANDLGVSTSHMPDYAAESTEVGKAYYDLYDAVYDALVAAGRTTEAKEMRPDVIWGMPYEAFADEVNKMPAANALTAEKLTDLEALIEQYEAMDDASRKAVASDVLTKYQALVKRGLALKAEGTTADPDEISGIYDEILALPAASEITESNVEATLAKVTEIEQKIDQLSEEEKSLLAWMGNSVTKKLEDIRKAAPKQDITVSFTLYGDTHHDIKTDDDIHTYFFDGTSLDKWIETTNVTVPEGSTVLTVFEKVLGEKEFTYINKEDLNYISSITTDKGLTLAEKNNTDYSGWMYLVNGTYADVGLNAKEVKNGDVIVWHFTDDYRLEHSGMAYTPERVIEYVANLYDVSTPDKANAAYNKISEAYQKQVDALRANRKSVRDVTALIDAITDWNVPMKTANDSSTVTKWVQDKLNKELEGKLDGVTLDVAIGIYRITPATDEADGKYTVEITVSKGSGSLGATSKLEKAGVIKAPSADAGVSSIIVCNTPATASEDGTYTVTVPYSSTVTAESFTITLSSDTASITAGPAETTESGVWAFTVTAENGTTVDYTVKVLVAADPAEGNKAAVNAAKAMLETASFIYASKDVNTEAAAKAAVERQIGALLGDTDISYEVTMTGFTAAVDGTLWSEPTNGSFSFTVKLTKGENDSYAEANVNLTGTITAASKPVTPLTPSKPTKPSTKPTDEPAKPDASKFVDVSKNNWYFDAVQYVLENGLMNGTSANEFSPNANTTRGMIVTILARLDGVDTSGSSPWYAAGRTWAMNAGVSDGTNMDGKITREQLAAMLYRYAKLKGYDVSASADISGYTDASSVSSWATDAMRWAVGAGLINGRTATMLAPQGNATRAEVAAILMRVEQKLAK